MWQSARRHQQANKKKNRHEPLNVQRKHHFIRINIFRMRAHNENVMHFLISIWTNLFKHISHVNVIGLRSLRLLVFWRKKKQTNYICELAFIKMFSCKSSILFPFWLTMTFEILSKCPIYTWFPIFFTCHSLSLSLSPKLKEVVWQKLGSYREYWKCRHNMDRTEVFVHATFPIGMKRKQFFSGCNNL